MRLLDPRTGQLLREHVRQKRGRYRIKPEDYPQRNGARHALPVAAGAGRTRRHSHRRPLPGHPSCGRRTGSTPHSGRAGLGEFGLWRRSRKPACALGAAGARISFRAPLPGTASRRPPELTAGRSLIRELVHYAILFSSGCSNRNNSGSLFETVPEARPDFPESAAVNAPRSTLSASVLTGDRQPREPRNQARRRIIASLRKGGERWTGNLWSFAPQDPVYRFLARMAGNSRSEIPRPSIPRPEVGAQVASLRCLSAPATDEFSLTSRERRNESDRTRSCFTAVTPGRHGRGAGDPSASRAQAESMAPLDLISCLVSDELTRRADRLLEQRRKQPNSAIRSKPSTTSISTSTKR